MANTPRRASWFSLACACLRKAATLAILPLAVASQAQATPPKFVPLDPPDNAGDYEDDLLIGGDLHLDSFTAGSLPEFNGIIGSTVSASFTATAYGSGGGTFHVNLGGNGIDGTISSGTSIPVSYSFTLSTGSSLTVTSWTLSFNLGDGDIFTTTPNSVSGSGLGTFTGNVNLVTDTATTLQYFPHLDVQVADVSGGDMLAINFASLSFNDASAATPVPEPAACAALLGAVALGFVALRRHAACA